MTELSRAALFGRLGSLAYRAVESGTALAKAHGHARVELAHWMLQIIRRDDSDLRRAASFFDIDIGVPAGQLERSLERLPRHAGQTIDLSTDVLETAERGFVYASLKYGAQQVRTGHLLIGIAGTPSLRRVLTACAPALARFDEGAWARAFEHVAADSPEAAAGAHEAVSEKSVDALARYSVDLTALAREGKLDVVIGRHEEIRQVIDILLRRRQNNPLLTGDAGVGKTAIVEGLAQRIVAGEVPEALRGVSLRALDVGLLQAGASAKGEFEARLRQLVDEVQAAQPPVILFIDEAHTLVGAGGTAGTGDAANLLKPALARGALRTIAATTWAEYKRHIEKDPALTRRFQPVSVAEPDEARALAMLRAVVPAMEAHHGVLVLEDALRAAVALSHRYINDRQLPDKAVSLLDTVCARVAASRDAVPPPLDRAREQAATLAAEHRGALREQALGRGETARVQETEQALAVQREQIAALEQRWREQARQVADVLSMRAALTDAALGDTGDAGHSGHSGDALDIRRVELGRLEGALREQQGETPLVVANVDRQAVASVVQDWTGIPVRRMLRDEVDTVLGLAARLDARIVGQAHATQQIARRVRTARAGLQRPGRPLGVFLLAGPSGVGKTETAQALAEAMYAGERNLITFNMSEYREPHTVSTLKGAPPGYVGYGEGGALTDAVRRTPYCVVLLDEIEKAHRDVHALFYQVFDKGWMEDGEGRVVDFRNTLILLTTNLGDDCIARAWLNARGEAAAALDALRAPLREALLTVFPAALLARMTTIPYLPLSDDAMHSIVRTQLDDVSARVHAEHGTTLAYDEAVVTAIAGRCAERASGARLVDASIAEAVLPEIGQALLCPRAEHVVPARMSLFALHGEFGCRIEP
ncbi:type VI secretion system ATPase TssH [Trinickia dabaoshanensis]|uniref:Type VI secretion system ATPase TssH n=1 Tax=Trinickia dabaoshanensis TaxID=564714 RepID=A0A2N7VTH3_9BURK|nr:type VI secretion system ATPase TssH [Trinickia dabaoshanensis]PMS20435.1 type VI secretion system ATPase TssH [Trinickia dabaoshanensis]